MYDPHSSSNLYYVLQNRGPNPYAFHSDKPPIVVLTGVGVIATAAIAATTATLPGFPVLAYVDEKGKFFRAGPKYVHRLMLDYPDLQEQFSNERKKDKVTRIKYIVEYNNRKIKETSGAK